MVIRVHSWLRNCLIGTLVRFVIFVVRIYFPLSELRGLRVLGGKPDLPLGMTWVNFVVNPLTSDADRRVFHKPQSLRRGGSEAVMFGDETAYPIG